MRNDTDAVLPLLIVLLIVGAVALVITGAFICLAFKQVIALVLVVAGVFLLVKPQALGSLSPTMRILIPFVLIALGVAIVLGYLWVG